MNSCGSSSQYLIPKAKTLSASFDIVSLTTLTSSMSKLLHRAKITSGPPLVIEIILSSCLTKTVIILRSESKASSLNRGYNSAKPSLVNPFSKLALTRAVSVGSPTATSFPATVEILPSLHKVK